jgi:hypothetical protein
VRWRSIGKLENEQNLLFWKMWPLGPEQLSFGTACSDCQHKIRLVCTCSNTDSTWGFALGEQKQQIQLLLPL